MEIAGESYCRHQALAHCKESGNGPLFQSHCPTPRDKGRHVPTSMTIILWAARWFWTSVAAVQSVSRRHSYLPGGTGPGEGVRNCQTLLLRIEMHAQPSSPCHVMLRIVSPKMSVGPFVTQQDLCGRLSFRSTVQERWTEVAFPPPVQKARPRSSEAHNSLEQKKQPETVFEGLRSKRLGSDAN
jgi:hypothetical protein